MLMSEHKVKIFAFVQIILKSLIDCVLATEANHLNAGNFLPPGNRINLLCSPEETPEETLVPERNKKSSEIHFQKKRP